jgi:NADH:ubiquinone oxidoreductase subunit 6 (subunit J)
VRERLKEPRKGSEIEPEIVCVQGLGADLFRDWVLFVERSSELIVSASISHLTDA